MPFYMEVKIEERIDGQRHQRWVRIRPSGEDTKPYAFATRAEADHMLWICYPGTTPHEARVVEDETGA